MKLKHLPLAALGGAALSLVPLAQQGSSAPAPLPGPAPAPGQQGGLVRQTPDFDAELWQSRLTAPNLSDRMVHYEALLELARRDSEAREALDAWTRSPDTELAWTATLCLRELRTHADAGGFGDPFQVHGGPGIGLHGDPFGELQRMEQRLDEMLRGLGGLQGLQGPHGMGRGLQLPPGGTQQSQGFQLEQGPDGVKITVTEQVDGDEQVTTYEGEDLDSLLEQHPELKEHMGGLSIGGVPGAGQDPFQRFFQGGDRSLRGFDFRSQPGQGLQRVPAPGQTPPVTGVSGDVRTDRLGVYVANPEAADGAEARGLAVNEVVPGSLADVLRVQAGDVLLELDGRRLETVADIATALERRAPGDVVRLRVADKSGSERELSWTPPR